MATGVAVDYGMLAAALVTAGWIIWRDRASGGLDTESAGLLFALMIAWSGHDSVLIGLAVVLLAVMLVRAITGHLRRPHAARSPRPSRASSRSASHTAEAPAKPRTRNGQTLADTALVGDDADAAFGETQPADPAWRRGR